LVLECDDVFSSRTTWDLAPNRLARAVTRLRDEGRSVIDLTGSNPTRAGFQYPSDLLTPLADGRALVYDPSPFGMDGARRAVAADYARRGADVPAERIVLTASTSEAYSLLFRLLADPGDEVLIPRPSYPLFEHLTRLDGVVARPYDLEYHGLWSIDFSSVERALTARTRVLVVVSPNNPTGSFVKTKEMDRLARLCQPRDVALLADEVFADYDLESDLRDRAASVAMRRDVLAFALGGLSKSIGLPQVKLGWMATGGADAVARGALERLELISDTYLSVSTVVQVAAAELLLRGGVIRDEIRARTAANYRRLQELARPVPSCRVLRAEGGWYAVVQVPSFRSEEDLVIELLESDGVLVHPGYFFDFAHESFLVVSLLAPEPEFADGVARLLVRAATAPS
jgi:hypothetical protein